VEVQSVFRRQFGHRDIWSTIESIIRRFADDCVIFRKITNNEDMEILEKDMDRRVVGAVEYAMKINPSKSTAVRFTGARVKDPQNYSLMDTLILEGSSCKYLGITVRSDLSWAVQFNYKVKKAWKALHFTMRILKKGNSNTKSLAYTSLVRPSYQYDIKCTKIKDIIYIKAVNFFNCVTMSVLFCSV
jgi:hypothetical protein